MDQTESNIKNLHSSEVQDESDEFVGYEFHRIINVEEDNTISITSHPNENKTEFPLIIINLNCSEINIEFDNVDAYMYLKSEITGVENDVMTSNTNKSIDNEPVEQNSNLFHVGDNLYKCTICMKTFFNSSTLAEHAGTHYSDDSKNYDFYKKTLSQKISISDIGDKLYKCEICSKAFFDSMSLARHARLHCTNCFKYL